MTRAVCFPLITTLLLTPGPVAIEPGRFADIITVEGDPLTDIN
jgi:hypothetical protein